MKTSGESGSGSSENGAGAGPPRASSGALLFGGDWAIAHGDADGLAHVARDLGDCVGGGLGHRLRALSQLCLTNYADAAARWLELKAEARTQLTAQCRRASSEG